jgi:hypothetical protein
MAGPFSLEFGSFSPITRSFYPHIKDKITEIERNSPILRSDCLRELRSLPIYKDTTPHLKAKGILFIVNKDTTEGP